MQCIHCQTPIPEDARFCHSCGSQVSDAEGQGAAAASMDRSAVAHMEKLLREETAGEVEIERMLGRGGMAMVRLDRKVAIKVLSPLSFPPTAPRANIEPREHVWRPAGRKTATGSDPAAV